MKQYTMSEVLANRALWSAALRSGDYPQTKEQLAVTPDLFEQARAEVEADYQDPDYLDADWESDLADALSAVQPVGFCCLGVACEVGVATSVIPTYEPSDGFPKPDMAAWLGLVLDGQTAVISGFTRFDKPVFLSLAELNDAHDFTFAEIADLLDDGLVLVSEDVLPDPIPTEGCFE